MTIEMLHPRTFHSAIKSLESLTTETDEYVFRGHNSRDYSLQTTLERYWPFVQPQDGPFAFYPIEKFISQYRDGLARIGLHPLGDGDTWLDWLEHARHHGVPAPLLDFSWSPYIALFFAFNCIHDAKKSQASVVYALNIDRLTRHWALRKTQDRGPGFRAVYRKFRVIDDNIAGNDIRFIPHPGPKTIRMQRQLGAFLYCTLDYSTAGIKGLEDYIDQINEDNDHRESPTVLTSNGPVLTKIVFRHQWAKEVFKRLELMNINCGSVLLSAEGVAMDIWNGYHYSMKASCLRRDYADYGHGQIDM